MDAPTRTTTTRDSASTILLVLAAGLAFRLILAYLLPGSGFANDLNAFRFWAADLAQHGLAGFYERPFFHDYTPGYLYFLYAVGLLGQALGGIGDLIKLPAILADVAIGWLVWSMAEELGVGRKAALFAGAIAVVNPISWFDNVVWGQVDSVGVVFLLLAIRELWRDRTERSAVFAVVAAIIKPQLGILVPIVAAVTIRRAFLPDGRFGADEAPSRSRLLPIERGLRGPIRILTTGLAGLLTTLALSAPVGLSLDGLVRQIFSTAAGYPYVTVNAYNPWALVQLGANGLAANGQWIRDIAGPNPGQDVALTFGAVPAVVVGTVLLLIVAAVVALAVARRPDRLTILVGVAVLALAFFVLPTRVHERYLFPFFAVAAILVGASFRWRIVYLVASAATLANMYVVLTTIYTKNPNIADWLGIGGAIRSGIGVTTVALAVTVAFGWSVVQLLDGQLRRLRTEVDASTIELEEEEAGDEAAEPDAGVLPSPGALPRPIRAGGGSPLLATTGPALASGGAAAAVLPAWHDRPTLAETGGWTWLRQRILERPVRPDRTATLQAEGGGRLDRLDLWLVVVLVAAVLSLRVWRLAEPYQMHFDEVYHARTATEFLQDWRYGLSHDIYEWTHPHLAKYAMAAGIVLFGDDRVSGTSQLGVPVLDAAIEPRYDGSSNPSVRFGDRVYVATGTDVRAYDLATRAEVGAIPLAGASAVAVDTSQHRLFVGTRDGHVDVVELALIDAFRDRTDAGAPADFATIQGSIVRLHATQDGDGLIAQTADNRLVMIDGSTGTVTGETTAADIGQLADGGRGPALTAQPATVTDPAATAAALHDLFGGAAARYETLLRSQADRVVLGAIGGKVTRSAAQAAIDDGRLAGLEITDVSRVAVGTSDGVLFLVPAAGQAAQTIAIAGGVQGVGSVVGLDDPKLYITFTTAQGPRYAIVTVGGNGAKDGPVLGATYPLPGTGHWVGYDEASQQVHILGDQPASRTDASGPTVYVIEPHGNAVYADAPLGFTPTVLAMDTDQIYPSSDRQQLLAFGGDGTVATVEVGKHAFAWRLPGVLAGAAMAALLYLLTRILFRRRSIALLVGLFTLVDGMMFVQSRIGMNDTYVGLFIIAAYVLFAAIWTGRWRWRGAFWVAMPAIGLLLGLALASKWVAAYAIGALGILILARSALGRVVLIAGMIGATTVLGYLAISVPAGQSGGNLTFALIMIGLTLGAVVVTILHPIAWSLDEARFAVGAPGAAGIVIAAGSVAVGKASTTFSAGSLRVTPLELGFALVALALVVAGLFALAGRMGFGPLARPARPDDAASLLEPPAPPAEGWLRPGWLLGVPVAWMVACLLVLPVVVYVISYIPWAFVENHQLWPGWPPGHSGQTLIDLTGAMYRYHNTLSSAHAASSPWWAWPFDLKPVWFYQESLSGGTAASIYDAGNLVIWWLGVPAMAFVAWQAYKRRSLALALVWVGFACQWISWARIDRAAFQYHYYTSLPFVIVALAYFVAELWHGASQRTWLLAKLAAGAAIVAPAALWFLHRPLCGFVRVTAVNPGSAACPTFIPEFVLTQRTAAIAVVLGVAVIVLVRMLVRLDTSATSRDAWAEGGSDADVARPGPLGVFGPLVATAAVATVVLTFVSAFLPESPLFTLHDVAVEPIALVVAVPLLFVASFVVTARDARRFVFGLLAAIVAEFVIFYPNIAALPLPAQIVNMYQGVLPTYVYPFQFPVSTVDRNVAGPPLIALGPAIFGLSLLAASLVIAYCAWVWRVALAERAVDEADRGRVAARGGEASGA